MAPQRTRKQKSGEASTADATTAGQSITFAPETVQPAATPERSPSKQKPMITGAQKQALIDNLQLEITERARKLRAVYALHAQGLRSRLEMRINRIPQSLRSTNIEELINKYSEQQTTSKSAVSTATIVPKLTVAKPRSPPKQQVPLASAPTRLRGTKRSSHEISTHSDKENADVHEDLDLPKKRTKTAAGSAHASNATARLPRGASRKVDPSQILSPKSHNSRTLPRSPIKGQQSSSSSGLSSPQKSYLARPASPLKPPPAVSNATATLAGMVHSSTTNTRAAGRNITRPPTAASTASTATTGSLRGKKVAASTKTNMPPPPVPAPRATRNRTASNSSNTSNTSAGTTIVKKAAAPAARKGIVGRVAGMAAAGRKAAAAKKEAVAAGAGGRTLRARK
ncbi:hypothetical protein NA57DRAFT_55801 [Rhizodiscina lignyota]|uniref:Borealin N-terminal domain-containing protein n=1 Tax=Rhizodiscina lignyota TaxID=1504668 RepID=A0A9P4IID7_9PEZI|nr:hypothetical protein NA57DRAFT_55801 [Rhizodiscina lignyota]